MAQISGIEVRINGDASGLKSAVNQAESALGSFTKTANAAANTNFAPKIQNAAYQIQDFAVQVASGTSATRAFAQQLPQLLVGFGTLGAVIGAAAAVAIPLGGAFLNAAGGAGKLGEAVSTIAPYAVTATAALAGFYAPTILAGLATTTSAVGVGLVGAIRAVTAAMMANPLGLLVAGVAAAAVAIFAFRDDIKKVFGVDFVGTIKDAVNWTIGAFLKLKNVIAIAFQNIGSILGSALVDSTNAALGLVSDSLKVDNPFAKDAADAGAAIGQALAENTTKDYLGAIGSAATDVMSKVGEMFSGGLSAAGIGGNTSNSVAPSQEPGTAFTDKLKQIQDHFKTERELLDQEYANNQNVLLNALNNELISRQEYWTLTEKLAQEHQDKITAIRQAGINTDFNALSSFFGSMQSAAQSGGKKMLKIAKIFAAAQAVVGTMQAAVSAMNDPTAVTPMQKFANFAAVFAKGMAAVAAIRGVSEGGGGNSGGGGGGAGAASAPQTPTTTFQFTLTNDPMGFGEKFARQFIDQLNKTQRNGGQIRGVLA